MTFGKTLLLAAAATAGLATAPALAVPVTYAVSQTGWTVDGDVDMALLSVTGTFVAEDKDGDGRITYYGDPAVDPLELFDFSWTMNFEDGSTASFTYADVFGFDWEIGDFLTGEDYVQLFSADYIYQTVSAAFGPVQAVITDLNTGGGYGTEEAMRVVPAPGALGLAGLGLLGLVGLRRKRA